MINENEKTNGELHTEAEVKAECCCTKNGENAERSAEVEKTIRSYVCAVAGLGVVPIPVFNLAAVSAVNLLLVRKLTLLYGLDFDEGTARRLISSFIGAGISESLVSTLRFIPIIGLPLSLGARPALNAMSTYALAQAFVIHFERGGCFINANIEALKECCAAICERICACCCACCCTCYCECTCPCCIEVCACSPDCTCGCSLAAADTTGA